ncbi:MAG TPA: aminotransferase class V-fold PLP-dependent enzyme [Candidatus Acidoferrales bacterium]|nr:aminotransferase class V-fold PLP-dependent enzyme [Candidatus Acidoferrales bacterium]
MTATGIRKMELMEIASERAARYLETLDGRSVFPPEEAVKRLAELGGELPAEGTEAAEVLRLLDEIGSPATVASAGRRYFGFVTGGAIPATLAANWLAGAWDQNAGLYVLSPVSAELEEISGRWLVEIFGLPAGTAVGFVTGATMANFTALAAARNGVLESAGWDVEADGLIGAPRITVIGGDEIHISVVKALGMLGLGRNRVVRVPADAQGRLRAELLPKISGPTIVCVQAGNVNTGAFDPAREICEAAHAAGAWVHVDGAFGLWAAAAPKLARLMEGFAGADSWATDAHKWLNVPYDCGIAFVRSGRYLNSAMAASAAYLERGEKRDPNLFAPEMSRRARGVEIWAALRSLGRKGIGELIERNCRMAERFAEGLKAAGFEILNDVVLNQVLVSFGSDEETRNTIAALQADGTCWCGGTTWHGRAAMRIAVSSWATTDDDVERSLEAMVRAGTAAIAKRK